MIETLLTLAFTAWAGVVGWAAHRITTQVDQMAHEVRDMTIAFRADMEKLEGYIRAVERRTLLLEQRDRALASAIEGALSSNAESAEIRK